MEEINVMLDEGAIVPTRAHSADAGLDLYTPEGFMLLSFGEVDNYTVDTGVHMEIPEGYVGMLKSKSGLNVNRGRYHRGRDRRRVYRQHQGEAVQSGRGYTIFPARRQDRAAGDPADCDAGAEAGG